MEWRSPTSVACVDIGVPLEKKFDDIEVPSTDGAVERGAFRGAS